MRPRPPPLEIVVDTARTVDYQLESSAPSSVFSQDNKTHPSMSQDIQAAENSAAPQQQLRQPPTPTIAMLFSLIPRRQLCTIVVPAILASIISGGVSPVMTWVIGQSYDAFASYPLVDPTPQDKAKLLKDVGMGSIYLMCLAFGAFALSTATSSLWIWAGETNVRALRTRVYESVTQKDMVWFDTEMGTEGNVSSGDGPVGAGGLMAKFATETDDVRMASSLASGLLLQYTVTTIACLALAFMRSWSLTLVILSTVPVLMFVQAISQGFAGPLLAVERSQTATAGTLIDRALSAIATVKAFNAAPHELLTLSNVLDRLCVAAARLNGVWALTSGLAQFVMMAMFVQGFWFGTKLVRDGSVSPGDVMAVFFACLIATSNLQMCIPQIIVLAKGKFAMAALLSLVEDSMTPKSRRPTMLRKIVPARCTGELTLHEVTFAYPSRPGIKVLQDVELFLPANETTFIVGGSGSGKSTIAQLLLRMYEPQEGSIQIDDQNVRYLDVTWFRKHVACVSQGCILFDMSVHDNIALGLAGSEGGRKPQDATRAEVIEACRSAFMHDFVRDLPDGYDTKLGNGGALLSGGQKQRLALARAQLRNPTVLILDEATSALDATSRVLVFEAIKRWRKDRTTIVITHDLSQIGSKDFVYALKNGRVVEKGYRSDLEGTGPWTHDSLGAGEFRSMMDAQGVTGGYLPVKDQTEPSHDELEQIFEKQEEDREEISLPMAPMVLKHQSVGGPKLRPLTMGNWMFDVVADLTGNKPADPTSTLDKRVSRFIPAEEFSQAPIQRRRSSIHIPTLPPPVPAQTRVSRRLSLQFTPTSPTFSHQSLSLSQRTNFVSDDEEFDAHKSTMQRKGTEAGLRRDGRKPRARWDSVPLVPLSSIKVETPTEKQEAKDMQEYAEQQSFRSLVRDIWPGVPNKPYLYVGLIACVLSGAMTPIFSYLLSSLMYAVATGAQNTALINKYGGIVLAIAAVDGILIGAKYYIMECAAMNWVTSIRKTCFSRILAQDKKWFDKSQNSPVAMVQVLIKDGDDARNLIAVVLGQAIVVVSMLGVGLIWALVRGWQLTLVGFAIAPVFGVTMAVQTHFVAKCELRNKRAREEVAKGYYESIVNVRGIRSMAFESVFKAQFDFAAKRALKTGIKGAFVEGCTYGVASGLIYLAEALLFYVGAILIANGTYTYKQFVEVLNLVVFSVTIGSQLMAFTEKIAKSTQATRDFNKILKLSTYTDESQGILRPAIHGNVVFKDVAFAYPARPDVQVLRNISLKVADGECVAIVGASGSGKSTIAALLQRLYEPDSGSISVGPNNIHQTDITHLREHVAVVSQNPNLFDATITENIAYGNQSLSDSDVRYAAQSANVHDFIMTLPLGYDTMVGENAALISGGQAQRLQIARALARPSRILILDECTSALDASNQAAVMDTIRHAKLGRTTIMVTHKLPVMRMCDRILVIHEGVVAEQGTYESLMERRGVFSKLASGGEWAGE